MNRKTITARKKPPLGSRIWTPEETEYLQEHWGYLSISAIANNLNRTENAIKVRVARLGLGPALINGDYITLNQLMHAVTGCQEHSYQMKSWVENRGMPVHSKKVGKCSFRIVYIDEFWEWAEKHRNFINFSKMEPLILGEEPEWVPQQRKKDYYSCALQRKDPWTSDEDDKLIHLLKMQKYGYAELSEIMHRSEGAIQRRCCDLGIKYRPVKADNHGADSVWKPEHYKTLAEGIKNGDSYSVIGKEIGKSEKAVRGKVYFVYLTENLDKVRAMLGDGSWGDNAPEPTVKQAVNLSRCRTAVKKDLSYFAALLKYRMNELGYDPYWQRFMCKNWDDFGGCSAGCIDCDSCTEFIRIREQYCARCGCTFYERAENRFCPDCRKARKRQAQKKYSILNSKGRLKC